MYLNCPQCRTANESDSFFCKSCGNSFAVKQTRKNSIVLPLIIIGSILAVCGFCGILASITGNKKQLSQSSNSSIKPLISSTSLENKTQNNSDNASQNTDDEERMATVISDNANLRKTNSAKSEVIGTLPKDSTLEVVKQNGAWFYVRAIGGQSGWLHGDTIRLKNGNMKETAVAPKPAKSPTNSYVEPRSVRPASTPEPVINNSGATAKCRDGSLSYSAHRRGTCSHHGGVAVWY